MSFLSTHNGTITPSKIASTDGSTSAEGSAGFTFNLYRYTLSLPAAAAAVVVFAVLTAIHLQRMFKVKAYYFTLFVTGGVCEYPALLGF